MTSDDLLEQYYEYAMEGPTLIPFIQKVLKGTWGTPDRLAMLHFLDRLEAIVLGNIETRVDEGPGLEADPEAVAEGTRREMDAARTLVLQALPEAPRP